MEEVGDREVGVLGEEVEGGEEGDDVAVVDAVSHQKGVVWLSTN